MPALHKIFVLLLIADTGLARLVGFQARMDNAELAGIFRPELDELVLSGSFNSWQASEAFSNSDGVWQLELDLPEAAAEWKLRIMQAGGGSLWEEGIGNRQLAAGEGGWLWPVWFNNDSLEHLPAVDCDWHVSIDMSLLAAQGRFDATTEQVALLGNRGELGWWQAPGALLEINSGNRAEGWITLSGLSDFPFEYKAVILDSLGQPRLWEGGENRSMQRTGSEPDQLPPGGDGRPELDSLNCWFDHAPEWQPAELASGSDLSFLGQLSHLGTVYHDANGEVRDPLEIFHQAGQRTVRLRLWVDPDEPWHGLDSTLAMAHRAVNAGFNWMLDFHYSDTWADPGHQATPARWQNLELEALGDSLEAYTARVLTRCCAEGIPPAWVQVGNEIDPGILWPLGRVDGSWDTPQQWDQLAWLLGRALAGTELIDTTCRPQRLIHLASSGNTAFVTRYMEELNSRGILPEGIGLSYYPWWHGSLADLEGSLRALHESQAGEIMIVESAYPWTTDWQDGGNNIVGPATLLPDPFPASPAGQLTFRQALEALLVSQGASQLIWWEPAWVAQPGLDCAWENLAFFDFSHQALPALQLPHVLEAPQLVIQAGGSGLIELFWAPVPGASRYRVEVQDAAGFWQPRGYSSDTSLLLTAENGIRLFRVTALDP